MFLCLTLAITTAAKEGLTRERTVLYTESDKDGREMTGMREIEGVFMSPESTSHHDTAHHMEEASLPSRTPRRWRPLSIAPVFKVPSREDWSLVFHLQKSETCKHEQRFFVEELDQYESEHPELRACVISTYGHMFDDYVKGHPCRVSSVDDASFAIPPSYLAEECNWPHYGGGDCNHPENRFRGGKNCRQEVVNAAIATADAKSKKVVLLDGFYDADLPVGSDDRLVWIKYNAVDDHFRPGTDIAMPPAPTTRCDFSKVAAAFEQPLESKRYFASFLGSIDNAGAFPEKIAFRRKLLTLNDPKILIANTEQTNDYDYDDLLQNSAFGLIPRGDGLQSYRYVEVICSGSVPVLLADKLVPCFEEVMAFDEYGVRISQGDVGNMGAILRKISWEEAENKRAKAKVMCEKHIQSIPAQFDTAVAALLR